MRVHELFRLGGKVALVTGGSRGLGFIMARGLAEAGAKVVLCARKMDACEQSAETLRSSGFECLALQCDVAEREDVKTLVEKTVEHFGHVDVLVNNAGYAWEAPLEEVSLDQWSRTFAVNATGTFLCSQEAGKDD